MAGYTNLNIKRTQQLYELSMNKRFKKESQCVSDSLQAVHFSENMVIVIKGVFEILDVLIRGYSTMLDALSNKLKKFLTT